MISEIPRDGFNRGRQPRPDRTAPKRVWSFSNPNGARVRTSPFGRPLRYADSPQSSPMQKLEKKLDGALQRATESVEDRFPRTSGAIRGLLVNMIDRPLSQWRRDRAITQDLRAGGHRPRPEQNYPRTRDRVPFHLR